MTDALRQKLSIWVEEKIGDKIDEHINQCLERRTLIDIDKFATAMVDDVLNTDDINKLKEKIAIEGDLASEFSYDAAEDDILDLDLPPIVAGELIGENERVLRELLQTFEFQAVDEIVCQTTWPSFRKVLQNILVDRKEHRLALVSLKVFRRLLASSHCPRAVCEGFATLADSIGAQLDLMNRGVNLIEAEDLYDIRDSKVYHRSSHRRSVSPSMKDDSIHILMKSLYLALSAHDNIPAVWIRFNERRLHEIVFSFVDMMAHSTAEKNKLSGLDLVTLLQPRANWCRHWTHGAISRNLLCQALRRHRRFFQSLVEIIILYVDKQHKPRRNSTDVQKPTVELSVFGVSGESLMKAKFCHCFSVITYLVKYRAGRTLFPLTTSTRRRPWTAHDMVSLMVDYIEKVHSRDEQDNSVVYKNHLLHLAKILLGVEEEILTARGTQRRN